MKVLLFGAIGPYPKAFSRALAQYAELVGCIVPREIGGGFDYWFRHQMIKHEVPGFACKVYTAGAYHEQKMYTRLQRWGADLVVVAGFPRKLPPWVNMVTHLGAVNVHPSLLPRDRGPAPAYWALRRGDAITGVTVHALTDDVDAGDVLLQAEMEVPFGGGGVPLLEKLGRLGGDLVGQNLQLLAQPWHLTPQGADVGPWARKPKHADLAIVAKEWGCKKLFHYVKGVRAFGNPWAMLADEVYFFGDALEFHEGRDMPGEFLVIGDTLLLKVADGTISLRILA